MDDSQLAKGEIKLFGISIGSIDSFFSKIN